jgi:thiol:disulfide interchange protein DsbA
LHIRSRVTPRRLLLCALSSLLLVSAAINQASAADQGGTALLPNGLSGTAVGQSVAQQHPYTKVHFPKSFLLSHMVIEVFEFGCPYCRRLNSTLLQWGATIPSGYRFSQIPILLNKNFIPMTLATFAVETIAPAKLRAFESASFSIVQDYHKPLNLPKVYLVAAAKAGIDPRLLTKAIASAQVQALVREDANIVRISKVTQTPSLIICGKYMINPSQVDGNYSMFIKLANGLLSRCIRNGA